MTSATALASGPGATDPRGLGASDGNPYVLPAQEFYKSINRGVVRYYCRPDDTVPPTQFRFRSYRGTADCEVTLIQYGSLIIVDVGEATNEFPEEHQAIIDGLRNGDRSVLAERLIELLRDMGEDPDEPIISIVSLQDMARVLIAHGDFADPSIGPDGYGITHAQWEILGDGALVISFLGDGEILLIAQADEGPDVLNISERGREERVLQEFGRLVPRRY